MILCLSCGYVSGAGAAYCGRCGLSLGCRICDNGHASPLGASSQVCGHCQSVMLSDGTCVLRLGWFPPLLTAILAVFLWKAALAHLPEITREAFVLSAGMAAFLLNTTPNHLAALCRAGFAWLMALWLIGESLRFLPSKGGVLGGYLRGLPLLLLRLCARAVLGFLGALPPLAAVLLFGRRRGRSLRPHDGEERDRSASVANSPLGHRQP